jgi:hypothetical protein
MIGWTHLEPGSDLLLCELLLIGRYLIAVTMPLPFEPAYVRHTPTGSRYTAGF